LSKSSEATNRFFESIFSTFCGIWWGGGSWSKEISY
jgi:hypothetical protein